jgi:TolB-like protein/tetratricopeptide (TPR) repeat protein
MTPAGVREQWREVQALLDSALDLPAGERDAFLQSGCVDRPALRAEVAALLRACDDSTHFLSEPVGQLAAPLLTAAMQARELDLIGSRIGTYRVVREAGRGGMGLVFVAERADGEYEKRVALKLVTPRPGLEAFSIQRFREERQILASLENQGIARMLDGGITNDGTPWFAMELVEGSPIDEHCTTHALGVAARLALFLKLCDTVRYAHARGIVHCDIKPANILVVGDSEVKLLDFGIATLSNGRDEQRGPRLMTPAYASPEQRDGAPATAASDVYSLGVLLEKLLGPAPPRGLRDIVHRAREHAPAKRYQEAGALADAVREWQDSRSRLAPAVSRKSFTLASTAVTALVLATLGAYVGRTRDARITSEIAPTESIVVFPFQPLAADSALTRMGRDLATTLDFAMARLGDVRVVGERELSARAPSPSDVRPTLEADLTFARALGASIVVRGTLERAGSRVRINAIVFATQRRAPVAYFSVTARADARAASDSLGPPLLHQLSTMRAARPGAAAGAATRSVPALEAYFEGEHLIADYRMPEAAAAFARAIQADSTFWLAAWRLQWAMAFTGRSVDSGITVAWRAHLASLSEPDRLLAQARLARRLVDRIALTRDVTRRHPEYWPAWLDYGDVLLHFGPYAGIPLSAARAPLERAVQLNPRLLPAWDHLMLAALSAGDTTRTAALLVTLRRLRYDSSAVSRGGLAMLDYYGYVDALLRSRTGVTDERESDAFVRLLALPNRGDEGRFQGGFLRYGFPRARIDAARRALAKRALGPTRTAFEWNEVASAWMARGAFDSALMALDHATRADSSASRVLAAYRLATVGAWLDGVSPAAAAARRPAVAQQARLQPPERVELAWVDGLLAVAQRDDASVARARARLQTLSGTDRAARLADSSLLGFAQDIRGDRDGAIRTMSALERDRFNEAGGRHPYRSGTDRLALGRWLRASGRNLDAMQLLMWPDAVIARDVPLATANAVLASPAFLERARAELASGDTLGARAHFGAFLKRYDMSPAVHAAWVHEAREAVARLE